MRERAGDRHREKEIDKWDIQRQREEWTNENEIERNKTKVKKTMKNEKSLAEKKQHKQIKKQQQINKQNKQEYPHNQPKTKTHTKKRR